MDNASASAASENHSAQQPTIQQALDHAVSLGLARLDAQMLLLHTLGRSPHDRAWLLAHAQDFIEPPFRTELQTQFNAFVRRRLDQEPLAYLTGWREFHGLELQVSSQVLDPRPDTETLVDWTLELLPHDAPLRVLDLGTGSGAIALALKHSAPRWQVHALDSSTGALGVARQNGQRLGLAVQFHEGNWLDGLTLQFDAIVSNPPYIAANDPHLLALHHEPLTALASGSDGLEDIRQIIDAAPHSLLPGGWLLFEHGHDQAAAVRGLLKDAGFTAVASHDDLGGIARCSGGRLG